MWDVRGQLWDKNNCILTGASYLFIELNINDDDDGHDDDKSGCDVTSSDMLINLGQVMIIPHGSHNARELALTSINTYLSSA